MRICDLTHDRCFQADHKLNSSPPGQALSSNISV